MGLYKINKLISEVEPHNLLKSDNIKLILYTLFAILLLGLIFVQTVHVVGYIVRVYVVSASNFSKSQPQIAYRPGMVVLKNPIIIII